MNSLRTLATTTFLLLVATSPISSFTPSQIRHSPLSAPLFSVYHDLSAEEALARAEAHLKKLESRQPRETKGDDLHPKQMQSIQQETLYQDYLRQSANSLKQELQKRKLNTKGRKPDLARRLAQHELKNTEAVDDTVVVVEKAPLVDNEEDVDTENVPYPVTFAGLPLSLAAASALHQAGFLKEPSPIQAASLSTMAKGESVLLHAPTGSGKTIAYVLPITEFLWRSQQNNMDQNDYAVIVTPTRELAAQVAGVASTLAPPGSVRLLSHPSNLMTDGAKDRKDQTARSSRGKPTIIVGSAKAIVHSLYGNEDLPAPPTPKPQALQFLKNVRVLVLDEVDRLLNVQGKHRATTSKKHEKPAAILTAAVARHTLGKAQIVAASATVGRPLKRELARVLGLPPPEGPRVIVAKTTIAEEASYQPKPKEGQRPQGSSRLVTIPKNVEHFLAPVGPKGDEEKTSSGQMLIRSYQVIQDILKENGNARILMVLARGFGITTQHVIGALQHFNCNPPPKSLLDALQENALDGTDHLVHVHRQVSGATGVGQSIGGEETDGEVVEERQSSSLWVTGEDTIRGLHLDGLDVVVLVGRPRGPDEYTHIAGRTGRAGRKGKVVAVISEEQSPLLRGWETMLQLEWKDYGEKN